MCVCVFLSMNGDSQEPAAKAGEKAVEVVKKFEELYIERDYDAMLDLMAEDVKAALPFRSASKGWYEEDVYTRGVKIHGSAFNVT